jgi:hypothetical protein
MTMCSVRFVLFFLIAKISLHGSVTVNSSACMLRGEFSIPSQHKWINLTSTTTTTREQRQGNDKDKLETRLIFFRRMRKAGSTTLRTFFAAFTKSHSGYSMQANEFLSFNTKCILEPNFSQFIKTKVLLITHLRDPISRLNSEFYYVGPGSERQGLKPSNDLTWSLWLNESKQRKLNNTFESLIRGGLYLDNIYVRALSGSCDSQCVPSAVDSNLRRKSQRSKVASLHQQHEKQQDEESDDESDDTSHKNNQRQRFLFIKHSFANKTTEAVNDADNNGVVHAVQHLSGCRLCSKKSCGIDVQGFRSELQPSDLRIAVDVLEHFDLVIITEFLSNPSYIEMIKSMMHAPLSAMMGHARGTNSSSRPKPSALITEQLIQHNRYDIELYEMWKKRTSCALALSERDSDRPTDNSRQISKTES